MAPATQAVFFDLDGTLADTAPDLCLALNRLLAEHGRAPVPLEAARIHTSSGARGMIGAGFGITPDAAIFASLRDRFLELYLASLCVHTQLFPGIPELLGSIESRPMVWGIVTNKAMRFTDPLVKQLGLTERAACIVSGDTTARAKPHPDSLLHAAQVAAVTPERCWYVGDDLRDIQAAHAAGMRAIAVRYGYLGDGAPPDAWGAEIVIDHPMQVIEFV